MLWDSEVTWAWEYLWYHSHLSTAHYALSGQTQLKACTVNFFVSTAFVAKEVVFTLNCHYWKVPLQAECSDWFQLALFLHHDCLYIQCPCQEKRLYLGVSGDVGWAVTSCPADSFCSEPRTTLESAEHKTSWQIILYSLDTRRSHSLACFGLAHVVICLGLLNDR